MSFTIQSQSSAEVPLDAVQSALPSTPSFLTRVWFCVPLATPQTSQPEPGSPWKSPTTSMTVKDSSVPLTSLYPSSPFERKL